MSHKNTIRKEKGIEICADLLFIGRTRKEIIEEITKDYKVSVASIDNWLKAARPVVVNRIAAANTERDRVDKEAMEASANRLNITRDRVAEQYTKIAFYDPEAEMKVILADRPIQKAAGDEEGIEQNPAGLTYGRLLGIKASDVKNALDGLCKMFGYNAPEKAEVDHTTNGQSIQQHTTLVIKPRNRREDSGD